MMTLQYSVPAGTNVFTQDDLDGYIKNLIEFCAENNINQILALARGGSIPATLLSYATNLPVRYVNYSAAAGCGAPVDDSFSSYHQLDHLIGTYRQDDVLLIIDDIAESGETMNSVSKWFEYNSAMEKSPLTTVVAKFGKRCPVHIDYVYHDYRGEEYIYMPWEILP